MPALSAVYLDARAPVESSGPPRNANLLDDLLSSHQRRYGAQRTGAQWEKQRELGWSDRMARVERRIPVYDATRDPHCAGFVHSEHFHASPYMQLMRQMQKEQLALNAGGAVGQRAAPLPPLAGLPAESDPSQQLTEVLAIVTRREALLERLPQLAPSLPQSQVAVAVAELRELTLRAVEAVLKWRRAVSVLGAARAEGTKGVTTAPPPFVWKGGNYLLKLIDDARAVHECAEVAAVLPPGCPTARNPLLLARGVDELSSAASVSDGGDALDRLELVRARRAATAIVREEQLNAARQLQDDAAATPEPRGRGRNMRRRNRRAAAGTGDDDDEGSLFEGATEEELAALTSGERTRPPPLASSEAMRLVPPALTVENLVELGNVAKPPLPVIVALVCFQLLLDPKAIRDLPPVEKLRNRQLRRSLLRKPKKMMKDLKAFDAAAPLPRRVLQLLWPILTSSRFGVPEVRRHSHIMGNVYAWVQKIVVHHMKLGAPIKSAPSSASNGIEGLSFSLLSAKQDEKSKESSSSDAELSSNSDREGGSLGAGSQVSLDDTRRSSRSTMVRAGRSGSVVSADGSVPMANAAHMNRALKELRKELAQLKSELSHGVQPSAAARSASFSDLGDAGSRAMSAARDARPRETEQQLSLTSLGSGPALLFSAPWRVGGEDLFDVRVLIERDATGEASLLIESFERDTSTNWPPITVLPFVVHQVTGLTPIELEAMPANERAASLQSLLSKLHILRATAHGEGSRTEKMVIESDPVLYRGQHIITKFRMDIIVRRLEGGRGAASKGDPVGLLITARQPSAPDIDTLELCVVDAEIRALLLNQPGLYERARSNWAARLAVAQWIVSRLAFERKSRLLGIPTDRLALDRTILLPPMLAEQTLSNGQLCRLELQQRGEAVVLRAVRLGDGKGIDDAPSTGALHVTSVVNRLSRVVKASVSPHLSSSFAH